MTSEQIVRFLEPRHIEKHPVRINFKARNPVDGVFIRTRDYEELKSKNFWRIVSEAELERWRKTGDMRLVRIFNGTEFSRLTVGRGQA